MNEVKAVEWADGKVRIIDQTRLPGEELYPEYIDRNETCMCLYRHMEGRGNYDNRLCLALTFELWLQQVFEARYRG